MRERWKVVALALVTVGLGLATRRTPHLFPQSVVAYGGDVLWATLVFWLLAWMRPATSGVTLTACAALVSLAVELSQLLTPQWLVSLRANPLAALVLGQGFLWSDLACYAVGVALAWWLDSVGLTRKVVPHLAPVDK